MKLIKKILMLVLTLNFICLIGSHFIKVNAAQKVYSISSFTAISGKLTASDSSTIDYATTNGSTDTIVSSNKIRLYSNTKGTSVGGSFYTSTKASEGTILSISIVLSRNNSNATAQISGSTDGETWTNVGETFVVTTQQTYNFDWSEYSYTYFKVQNVSPSKINDKWPQLQVESISITFGNANDSSVEISGDKKVYLGSNVTLEAIPHSIANPGDATWSSLNEEIASVNSNGVVTANKIGLTKITATINDITSNEFEVKVFPVNNATLTIVDALTVCELTGATATTEKYSVIGQISSIETIYNSEYDNISLYISDGVNSILCYRLSGGNGLKVGDYIVVTGKLKQYNSDKEFDAESTYVKATTYTIDFDTDGGSEVPSQIVLSGNKVVRPADPTKDNDANGVYEFNGWYSDDIFTCSFDFDTEVTENITLYAKWRFIELSPEELFEKESVKANLTFGYKTKDQYGEEKTATMSYSGSTTNMTASNNAATVGLDENIFNVVSTKIEGGNNHIGLNIAGEIRLYTTTKMTVSTTNAVMTKIVVTYKDKYANESKVKVNGNAIDASVSSLVYTYNLPQTNEVLFDAPSSTNRILSIVITYKELSYIYSINQEEDKNLLSIQFACNISNELKAQLDLNDAEYGMVYCANGAISPYTIAQCFESDDVETMKAYGMRFTKCTPVQVDETGFNDGTAAYQWGVSINNISLNYLGVNVVCCGYVLIDGTYYLTEQRMLSLFDLVQTYIDATDTSAYSEHLGALQWLASLKEE